MSSIGTPKSRLTSLRPCRMRGMVPVLGGGAMAAPSTNEEASGSLGRPILSEGFQKTAAQ